MKRYTILILLLVCGTLFAHAQRKSDRIAEEFAETQKIVDNGHFRMDFNIATTYNSYYQTPSQSNYNENIRIGKDSAYVVINDSIAEGYLPYFNSGYSFPKTGVKGIVFVSKMLNKTVKIKGKRGKRSISYEFDVIGLNDTYKLNLEIQYDGTCYLFVNSGKRSPITYQGKLCKVQ